MPQTRPTRREMTLLEGDVEMLRLKNKRQADEIARLESRVKTDGARILKMSDEYEALRDGLDRLTMERNRLRAALQSIAGNTCCDGCQEAAKWARAALRPNDGRTESASLSAPS